MNLNLNELHSPDPVPRDGSILRLQQQHRFREVWEADWPETHTFHLRPGESTITLQDVEVLLGIPVKGKPVTGNTNLKPYDLCKRLLGEQPTEESDINGMKVKASWLSDRFSGQVEEGADPKVVARQARDYLLLLMGEPIFADHSGGFVHLANLERLENFDEAGTYSWGSGALANLYHNLCHGCKVGTKQITGCFILLQVWAWEQLPYLALGRLGKRASKASAPLIGRWDDVFHSPDLATYLVGAYRYHFDIQRSDEVIWTPYSEELFESLPEYCRAGRVVWWATVPLIYYATCQYHQPERVMRQFGFRQCIPPPSRSLDPPHGKTLQNGALDWALKYRTIIQVWNNRLNLVVPPGDIDLVEYPFDDPYVAWYDRITRRCISPVGCGVDGVAKRKRIDESSLRDVRGSVGDGDITQLGLDTQDLHVDPQHEAEAELDFVSNNDGQDDEVEEEADFQDSTVGGDRDGGGEVTQTTTKTHVVAQRRSKRQRKKPRCGTGGTMCEDGGGKTKRACY
ncbi:hypothetical protein RHMOL_Rhmol03G0090100 [Rhododendron molle]|uniref:Uncharacterized protein n=1 Tax=Rhododendron molle TaxID=49168 RepID=A0ACC0PBS0_RHOML|nr:hypothetical protein RHMOL_Rhmol03G0090100 [Rhododendron molle]